MDKLTFEVMFGVLAIKLPLFNKCEIALNSGELDNFFKLLLS